MILPPPRAPSPVREAVPAARATDPPLDRAHDDRLVSLGLLAGGIAHDFANLMHVIGGYTDLALQKLGTVDETSVGADPAALHAALHDAEHAVRIVHDTALRASTLVRQLLQSSRQPDTVARRVPLADLLRSAMPTLQRLAGPLVQLDVRIDEHRAPAIVQADPVQLEQVLFNLVVNAHEAQPEGGRVEVQLNVVPVDQLQPPSPMAITMGLVVRLCVTDDGPGIPSSLHERVFDPFFTTKAHGTGLGLATVRTIVRHWGGDVRLGGRPGEGLAVEVLLPWSGAH